MSNMIALPRIMHVGAGALSQVTDVLKQLGCKNPLIITDAMMVQLGYVERLESQLQAADVAKAEVFAETVPEPTEASLLPAVDMVKEKGFDCLIALGGGSPIDSAKAIAILASHGGVMADYKVPRVVDELGLPLIAIPTTGGTGSEATKATVITDQDRGEKMLCMGLGFVPYAAIVDYELTLSLPPRTTADTAIDALTHAIEAYVSKKANLFTDAQALQAMGLIAPNLRIVYNDGQDAKAREKVMLGATLAGVAFSNASVALVHGMSRPIGAFFHVPHGLSNAMLLPAVTRFSLEAAPDRYANCARAMGLADANVSDEHACQRLQDELIALNRDLKVPSPSEFGIEREAFFSVRHTMAEQALASGSPANNPRVPTLEEMVSLYEQLWT